MTKNKFRNRICEHMGPSDQ